MRQSIKGVSPEWWTLPGDDDDDPVQFYLVPLDGLAWTAVLMDSYNPDTGEIGGTGIIRAFRTGVKNWRNIEDADNPGKPLKFSKQAMPKLNPGWIFEVGHRVLEISQINAEEAKNSVSPPLSVKK